MGRVTHALATSPTKHSVRKLCNKERSTSTCCWAAASSETGAATAGAQGLAAGERDERFATPAAGPATVRASASSRSAGTWCRSQGCRMTLV